MRIMAMEINYYKSSSVSFLQNLVRNSIPEAPEINQTVPCPLLPVLLLLPLLVVSPSVGS